MSNTTSDKILDAAERLFAQNGFSATSMRAITRLAGVNLAAVNYHFGNKKELLKAVYQRRLGEINQKRLLELERLKSKGSISIEALVEIFIKPALQLQSKDFIKLLGRSYIEDDSDVQVEIRSIIDLSIEKIKEEMAKLLPELSQQEFYWRMHFMTGALAYCMSGTHIMRKISSSSLQESSREQMMAYMVNFLSTGLKALPAQEIV